MNFVHPHFFIFFAIFLCLYFTVKGKLRLGTLLLGSYFFYGYFSIPFCSLLIASTFFDFTLAKYMEGQQDRKKMWVLLSVVGNLGLLGYFKYHGFFWNDILIPLNQWLPIELEPYKSELPPMGISFFTFQTMSYSIDVYRGKIKASQSLLEFACYVSMFPQLVAGPIVRAKDLLPQLKLSHSIRKEDFKIGIKRFIWGFMKKACLADSLAVLIVDPCFARPENYTEAYLFYAMIAYSFQIYFDFSGYSDMAIGVGRMLGFKFPENFNHPYQSASFSEFWTRWHISLSSWLRDYLYIPLGGNRKGELRTYVNLLLTMLLGGLWHGASFLFILWGFIHGLLLVVEKLALKVLPTRLCERTPKALKVFWVFMAASLAWIPFRAGDMDVAYKFYAAITEVEFKDLLIQFSHFNWSLQLLFCICFISHFFKKHLVKVMKFESWPMELKACIYASLLFWMLHYYPEINTIQPFIYFQF